MAGQEAGAREEWEAWRARADRAARPLARRRPHASAGDGRCMGICVSCRRRERKAPEKRWVPAKGAAAELLPRQIRLPTMANSISNIKMTNPIKGMVSKRRKRYVKDGFNLDLACILFL